MHEGHRERMRRRLFEHGSSLTDHELFEILLFEHIPRKDTNPVAHALLDSFGDPAGVFAASPRLLCSVGSLLAIAPILVIFAFCQKAFIQGTERTGLVG